MMLCSPLPGQLLAVVLIEAAIVRLVQLANCLHNLLGAGGHVQGRIVAAHVSAHPAGMQADAEYLLWCQIDAHRLGGRIERRLGSAIWQEAAIRVRLYGAQNGAHIDNGSTLHAKGHVLVDLRSPL